MLNESVWAILTKELNTKEVPLWVRSLLNMSYEAVEKLPSTDSLYEREGFFYPSFRMIEITPDYLRFLDTQIRVEPKGPAWSQILKSRLTSLAPHTGKKILELSLFENCGEKVSHAWAVFTEKDMKLVHFEVT